MFRKLVVATEFRSGLVCCETPSRQPHPRLPCKAVRAARSSPRWPSHVSINNTTLAATSTATSLRRDKILTADRRPPFRPDSHCPPRRRHCPAVPRRPLRPEQLTTQSSLLFRGFHECYHKWQLTAAEPSTMDIPRHLRRQQWPQRRLHLDATSSPIRPSEELRNHDWRA